MEKIRIKNGVLLQLNGTKKNTVITIDDNMEVVQLKNRKTHKTILLVRKKVRGTFVELDKSPKYVKQYKKASKKVEPSIVNKSFSDVNPEDWRPKHIVQYVRNRYEIIYNSIPLELQWSDRGYTPNPRERSKSWAYAKHLLDKLQKIKISKKRLRHYIDWCFSSKDIPPTMALISCNNWLDSYNYEFKNKRIRQSKIVEIAKNRTELWEKQAR